MKVPKSNLAILPLLGSLLIGCGNESTTFRSGGVSSGLSEDAVADWSNRSSDQPGPNGEFSEAFYIGETETKKPIDIVLAMDTSLSMKQERLLLESNISMFLENLKQANLDVKITAIGNPNEFNFPAHLDRNEFAVYGQSIGSWNSLNIVSSFLKSSYKPLPFRNDAHLEIIFFSDDNPVAGKGMLASQFSVPQDKSVSINAVVGLEKSQSGSQTGCNISNVGSEFIELANQTAGKIMNLCNPNWTELLGELSEKIIEVKDKIFALSYKPDELKEIKVFLNGVELHPSEYKIFAENQQLEILAAADHDDEVIIEYIVE